MREENHVAHRVAVREDHGQTVDADAESGRGRHAVLERAQVVLVERLGFVINYNSGRTVFVKAPNGSMIEMISAEGERGGQTMKLPGIRHLALTVDDFGAEYARLQAAGVSFLGEPQDAKGVRTVFFTDPEGNYLHLIQRESPLAAAILPSRLIANFAVTNGLPVRRWCEYASSIFCASDSQSPGSTSIPASESIREACPWARGSGSSIA